MEQQSNDTDRQKRKYSKKSLYCVSLSTINLSLNGLRTNPVLRDERTATKDLKM